MSEELIWQVADRRLPSARLLPDQLQTLHSAGQAGAAGTSDKSCGRLRCHAVAGRQRPGGSGEALSHSLSDRGQGC